MVSIRSATPDDAVAIARVHVESWRSTYAGVVPDAYLAGLDELLRVQLWHEWLLSGALVLVAELKGVVVGFVHAGATREGIKTADSEVYSLYLLNEAQGRGIGRRLLRAIAAELQRQGFTSLGLWVLERNRARGFYESCAGKAVTSKVIEIGGARLMEVAYWWPELSLLVNGE